MHHTKQMRFLSGFVILFFLAACSKPGSNENQVAAGDKADTTATASMTNNPGDTIRYIGYIQKFEDNRSFYTDLHFVEGFNYDLFNDIARMSDKVIFKDQETTRIEIDVKKAGQFFNLTGFNTITIYNRDNQPLTTGRFSHIEYVEDQIESKFVAVFDVANPDISDHLFCIGNMRGELSPIKFSYHEDEKVNSDLINYLELNTENLWGITHYQLDDQPTYSTVSADTTAYIVDTAGKTYQTVYKSKFSELISQLTIISKKINGRHVLLTISGMPETDMGWSSLLVFNGMEYEVRDDHRIKVSESTGAAAKD